MQRFCWLKKKKAAIEAHLGEKSRITASSSSLRKHQYHISRPSCNGYDLISCPAFICHAIAMHCLVAMGRTITFSDSQKQNSTFCTSVCIVLWNFHFIFNKIRDIIAYQQAAYRIQYFLLNVKERDSVRCAYIRRKASASFSLTEKQWGYVSWTLSLYSYNPVFQITLDY